MSLRAFKIANPVPPEEPPRVGLLKRAAQAGACALSACSSVLASSVAIGLMLCASGFGLLSAGVFVLAGVGWALLVGALPFLLLGFVLLRGAARVG